MKCPKCHYLGFETGDRCRNCGYDFSLAARSAPAPGDLPLHERDWRAGSADAPAWDLDLAPAGAASPGPRDAGRTPAAESHSSESLPAAAASLPLFESAPGPGGEPEPLVRVPAEPRRPLALRKSPEIPRLQGKPRAVRTRPAAEPRLDLPEAAPELAAAPAAGDRVSEEPASRAAPSAAFSQACGAGPRALAAAIDLGILAAVCLIVLYLTLRLASLTFADWQLLPPLPLMAFLTLVAVGYFAAFTAVGGQTIGKMAARIRVVSDDGGFLSPARAVQRTLAGIAAFATLGAAFAPALTRSGRALHDRVARTRVVRASGS